MTQLVIIHIFKARPKSSQSYHVSPEIAGAVGGGQAAPAAGQHCSPQRHLLSHSLARSVGGRSIYIPVTSHQI